MTWDQDNYLFLMKYGKERVVNAEVVRLLFEGKTPREIRAILPGVEPWKVSHLRGKIGLPPFRRGGPRGFWNKATARKVRELKITGLSYRHIGERLGFSPQRAQAYLRCGESPRGKSCERCGTTIAQIHRHHVDYATDQIQYLCSSCHRKAHSSKAAIQRSKKVLALSHEL